MKSTIIIPTYNQDISYLKACLISAKTQSHKCEVVVIDDGSTPNQESVVEEIFLGYSDQYNIPCKYVYQENLGVSGALNRGIEESSGEYIQWLPSDDLFLVDKTSLQLKHMQERGSKVSYTAYEEGIPIKACSWPVAEYPNQKDFFDALRSHCFINAATVMFHRDIIDELGGFDPNMVHCQDYEFLLRMAEKYNFSALNLPLVRRRIHEGQMLQTLKTPEEREKKNKDMEYIKNRYGVRGYVWIPDNDMEIQETGN